MKKLTKLQSAILLAALSSSSYANDSCLAELKDTTPLEVFQCFEAKLNKQKTRIAEIEKGNQAQQGIIDKQQAMIFSLFQRVMDAQQQRLAKLEKGNKTQQGIIDQQEATILLLKHNMLDDGIFPKAMIVYNSVANEAGENAIGDANTLTFWQISYKDRLKIKGIVPDLRFNYYNPTLYQKGTYIDVVEDLDGKVAILMKATAEGIDPKTMKMINPKFLEGDTGVFNHQFASGWSSSDHDGDTWGNNCATVFGKVTQHYSACWNYSLGSDADSPYEDKHWGPHVYKVTAQSWKLKTDGSNYTRVRRITRYVIF